MHNGTIEYQGRKLGPLPSLEGPFRMRSGWVGYYDPREGRYYDRLTDTYLDREDKRTT
jgi:hypothetical protein